VTALILWPAAPNPAFSPHPARTARAKPDDVAEILKTRESLGRARQAEGKGGGVPSRVNRCIYPINDFFPASTI